MLSVGFFRWKCSANVPQPNLLATNTNQTPLLNIQKKILVKYFVIIGWVKREGNPTKKLQLLYMLYVGFFRWKCSANVPQPNLLATTNTNQPPLLNIQKNSLQTPDKNPNFT